MVAMASDEQEFLVTFTAPGQEFEETIKFLAVPAAVSEPTTLALIGSTLMGLELMRIRRTS
jgi:hypothetical protein